MRKHTPRVWHLYLADGGVDYITAHDCDCQGGHLTFWNWDPVDDEHLLLIKAFPPALWTYCELVDTPDSPDVHLKPVAVEPYDELVGQRH